MSAGVYDLEFCSQIDKRRRIVWKPELIRTALKLKDQVVSINRVTKVVKGGKNLSFSALVVVGDENGVVGYGNGKARKFRRPFGKPLRAAKKNLIKIPMLGTTIPHLVVGRFGSGKVLVEAGPGRHRSDCRWTCACSHSVGREFRMC